MICNENKVSFKLHIKVNLPYGIPKTAVTNFEIDFYTDKLNIKQYMGTLMRETSKKN